MCLINFSYRYDENYALVVAANRDEFYHRPTKQADFWKDYPFLLAGQDLEMMGTWFGVTKAGRMAWITNYRDQVAIDNPRSRGELVKNYLCGDEAPRDYLTRVANTRAYNGFNLVVGDANGLFYYSNRSHQIVPISSGLHSMSNHLLNTPWPKVTKGKNLLGSCLQQSSEGMLVSCLMNSLTDEQTVPDEELPDTGVGIEMERMLAPMYIRSSDYGTRSSTVLTVDYDQNVTFYERTYHRDHHYEDVSYQWTISK